MLTVYQIRDIVEDNTWSQHRWLRASIVGAGGRRKRTPALKAMRKLSRQGDSSIWELLASDVGPVPRRFLTETDGLFDSL